MDNININNSNSQILDNELHKDLLEHTGVVLTILDLTYFVVIYLTSANPYLSVFFAILFPLINLPMLKLSNKTGFSFIKYSLTFTLIPMFLVTYYSGSDAPGWILCFSGATATQLMVTGAKYRASLMCAFAATAVVGSALAGKSTIEVTIIFITLLAFIVILNRIFDFMMLQYVALNQAKREAEAGNKAKSNFLSNMNHELRTPMNGVLGAVQILETTNISQGQQQYIDILKSSGEHLLEVINDILDISKLEAGQLVVEQTAVCLVDCTNAVQSILSSSVASQHNNLKINTAPQVPKIIVTDPVRLKQILFNLLGNANKFTQCGQLTLSIEVQSQGSDEMMLVFEVKDTGIGIAVDKRESIFESFSQADVSITREYGGTGLGLSICKQLVEQLGGKIWLVSELGCGSSFFFTLKTQLIESSHLVEKIELYNHDNENSLAERFPINILIAEDNMINQVVIVQILKNLGYQVDVANHGLEVLKACEVKNYDLILMDIQMPEMDGLTATRRLKQFVKADQKPLIVAMTANTAPQDIKNCFEAGMIAHLGKPVEVSKLAHTIERLFS